MTFAIPIVTFSLNLPVLGDLSRPVEYDIKHTFNTRVIGNQVYRGAWQWSDHAIAKDENPPGTIWTVNRRNANNATFTPPATDTQDAPADSGDAEANASSQYQANADGTGFARVFGGGKLGGPNARYVASEASTTVGLNRGVRNRNGGITWSPEWKFVTARTGHLGDPIDVSFLDLDTMAMVSSQLFDLDLTLGNGGSSSYLNGDVTISGTDGMFTLAMDSPYITSGTGTIVLGFSNGLVTESEATGIFAGLLPGVGSDSSAIGFHLGDINGAFDIEFDFGAVPGNVNGYDFQAQYDNSAFVEAVVPEPCSVLLAGAGLLTSLIGLRKSKAIAGSQC